MEKRTDLQPGRSRQALDLAFDVMPLVSLIIPNYNGAEYLRKYMRSVLDTNYPNLEIIFVDDGSTDDSIKVVKEMFSSDSKLRTIRHHRNLGLAYARNTGIREAKGPIIAFLDNDIEVDPNWLTELVKVLESDKSIGVAMSKTFDMNDRNRIQCAGQLILPYIGWTISRGYGEIDNGKFDKVEDVYACLNAVAIKREVLEKIGLIDTKMTFLWEDIDFEWRVWLSGYKEVLVPTSKVWHLVKPFQKRDSAYRWTSYEKDFLSRDFLRFFIKNYEVKKVVLYLPIALLILLRRCLLGLKRGETWLFVSFVWSLVRQMRILRDTLLERKRVQSIRKASTEYILAEVGLKNFVRFKKYHTHAQNALRTYFLR